MTLLPCPRHENGQMRAEPQAHGPAEWTCLQCGFVLYDRRELGAAQAQARADAQRRSEGGRVRTDRPVPQSLRRTSIASELRGTRAKSA